MSSEIIGLTDWLKTPAGAYLLAWEHEQFDEAVSDIFGYHALQLGLPELAALRSNRMPHQWLALEIPPGFDDSGAASATSLTSAGLVGTGAALASSRPKAALITHAGALPFSQASLDLVVLPHTLELSDDPHATLREVERVLVPEGRVVISGLNPASLWGMRQRRAQFLKRWGYSSLFLPEAGDFIGYWRLRDWLRLLDFEVESARFGCYRPAMTSEKWLARFDWMDAGGKRWWPIFGAVYFVVAVKRVRGMRLLEAGWKRKKVAASAPATVAGRQPANTSGLQRGRTSPTSMLQQHETP